LLQLFLYVLKDSEEREKAKQIQADCLFNSNFNTWIFQYIPDPDKWTEALSKEQYFCYISPLIMTLKLCFLNLVLQNPRVSGVPRDKNA